MSRGTDVDAALCLRSLLSNLRKLNLIRVAVSLPALQPVATRLRELNLDGSCLQGSANGFLTRGWTALTTLSLEHARMETATMTAALSLPALEEMDMNGFRHQGGELQLDQLIDGCPHVRGFSFQLEDCVMQGSSGPYCSLLGLGRLTDLSVWTLLDPHHETLDLDLPAGLTRLSFDASRSEGELDFFWALNEAARCIGRGARLRKLVCTDTEADRQPAQWRLSLEEQYRRLGGRLTSLHELEVVGDAGVLLAALGAVVSAAPSLTCARLTINATEPLPRLELPPICSASLKSITVGVDMLSEGGPPLPPLVLTFLPGCTRLREVVVRIGEYAPTSGTAVKIRCHACSSACIAPMDVKASGDSARIHDFDGPFSEMGVRLLPGPPSPQGVQSHTVIYACHAAGPQQPLVWSHAVMPGFL